MALNRRVTHQRLVAPDDGLVPFNALSQQTVSRSGTKARWDSDLNLVEDSANTLGLSYDPATGDRLGYHYGDQIDRLTTSPVPTASNVTNLGATLTDLSLNAFGTFPGVLVASTGQEGDGARLDMGALTAGDTIFTEAIYQFPQDNSSGQRRFLIDGDGFKAAFGAPGTVTGGGAGLTVLSDDEIAPGVWRLRMSFEAQTTASYAIRFTPNTATSGDAVILLHMAAYSSEVVTPILASPGSSVTQLADNATAPWPEGLRGVSQRHEFTFTVPYEQPNDAQQSRIYELQSGGDVLRVYHRGSDNIVGGVYFVGGANVTLPLGAAITPGVANTCRVDLTRTSFSLTINGATTTGLFADRDIPDFSTIYVGQSTFGGVRMRGGVYIANLTGRPL